MQCALSFSRGLTLAIARDADGRRGAIVRNRAVTGNGRGRLSFHRPETSQT